MKFDSIIKSNHEMKKNGYKILRKLHKLEKRANLQKAYTATCKEGYFVVLSCKNLAEILFDLYGNRKEQYIQSFLEKTNSFIEYFDSVAASQVRINSKILARYLTNYTQFFNRIIDEGCVKFSPNSSFLSKWNVGCIMAYTAVWGNRQENNYDFEFR